MTRLSVNINKIATIRNARGGDIPNVVLAAGLSERFGADGITVHPRPDERHIKYDDVKKIRPLIKTEFNIEGYPSENFLNLISEIKPHQVTLVPDKEDVLTSNQGWEINENMEFLKRVISEIKKTGARVSVFVDSQKQEIKNASKTGADRIELYTEPYAAGYSVNPEKAVKKYVDCSELAYELGLGINAGHDLNLDNLEFFSKNIPWLDEVSIGHALISDSIYYGLENTIQMYKRKLK